MIDEDLKLLIVAFAVITKSRSRFLWWMAPRFGAFPVAISAAEKCGGSVTCVSWSVRDSGFGCLFWLHLSCYRLSIVFSRQDHPIFSQATNERPSLWSNPRGGEKLAAIIPCYLLIKLQFNGKAFHCIQTFKSRFCPAQRSPKRFRRLTDFLALSQGKLGEQLIIGRLRVFRALQFAWRFLK